MCCLCTTCPKECTSQQLRDPTCQGTSVASGRQHLRGASLGLQGLASILRGHFLPESVCWGIADVAVPWAHKDPWTQHVAFFLFFLFFFLPPCSIWNSKARDQIRAAAANYATAAAMCILNPLCWAGVKPASWHSRDATNPIAAQQDLLDQTS